jgi:hypothetical protein
MINGCGTTLYGKRHLTKKELTSIGIKKFEGLSPYVSTMWFCLIFIPLIPLGSYVVFGKYAGKNNFLLSDEEYYQMVRINMNWNQVLKIWLIPVFIIFLWWLLVN